MYHYYAVRPASTDPELNKMIRIEKADTPVSAIRMAFGRGTRRFVYKDLGTQNPWHWSDKKRIKILTSEDGWYSVEE